MSLILILLISTKIEASSDEESPNRNTDLEFVHDIWEMLYERSFINRKEVPVLDWSIAKDLNRISINPSPVSVQKLKLRMKKFVETRLGATQFRKDLLEKF